MIHAPPAHILRVPSPITVIETVVTQDDQGHEAQVFKFPTMPPVGSVVIVNAFSEGGGTPPEGPQSITDTLGAPLALQASSQPAGEITSEFLYDYVMPFLPNPGHWEYTCNPDQETGTCFRLYGLVCVGCAYPGTYYSFSGPVNTEATATFPTSPGALVVCGVHANSQTPTYGIEGASGVAQIMPNVRAAALYGTANGYYVTFESGFTSSGYGWTLVCATYFAQGGRSAALVSAHYGR